jgi:ABC-type phosphonate transport system ATPase subunit
VGEPILSVLKVTKRFGGIVALYDVSLDIQKGEIVGLNPFEHYSRRVGTGFGYHPIQRA